MTGSSARSKLAILALVMTLVAAACSASPAETEWVDSLDALATSMEACGATPASSVTAIAREPTAEEPAACRIAAELDASLPEKCNQLRLSANRCASDLGDIREYGGALVLCTTHGPGSAPRDLEAWERCMKDNLKSENKFRPD